MKGISRASIALSAILFVLAAAYVLSVVAMPHIEYNDVGPAPLFLLALFVLFPLCLIGTFVLPSCTAVVTLIACIAMFRDQAKRWGAISMAFCVASAGLLMLGRHIDNEMTEESQQDIRQVSSEAAPSAPPDEPSM